MNAYLFSQRSLTAPTWAHWDPHLHASPPLLTMLPGWELAEDVCLSACGYMEGGNGSVRDPQPPASLSSLVCSLGGNVVRNIPRRADLLTRLPGSGQVLGLGPKKVGGAMKSLR